MADEHKEQLSGYISIEEAATALQMARSNLYYYLKLMHIEPQKFPLDRKTYIRRAEMARIQVARGAAATSTRLATDDLLVFLAGLGLAVTPHTDPGLGWGFAWFGGEWVGPYPTPVDAIKAAFEQADQKAHRLRDMPFPTMAGELFWWDGEAWFGARQKDGELQIQTFAGEDGYEPIQTVIERSEEWLHPAPPTGDAAGDEERERARLAALWLTSALRQLHYNVEPISWQQDVLHAQVVVNDRPLGDLLTVYNRFRGDDNFFAWLREQCKGA